MNVEVFPNGYTSQGYVQFGLNNQSDDAITVKGKISTDVLSQDFRPTIVPENEVKLIGGYLKHDQCLNEYKDKDFVATVDMVGLGDWEIVGKKTSEGPKELSVWEKVYTNMEKADFTFVFDNQEVPCHKLVLAAASPVLRAMVENKHREAIESKANIELSEEIGQAFVRFIYTGNLDQSLLKDQAAAFLELGEMWDLQELKNTAERELLKQLEKETMVRLLYIGDLFRAEQLFEAALYLTKANISWLRSQEGGMEEVMKMSKEIMARLI